jgi:hypothetical protein
MINQIKKFKGNALALELIGSFTETDALFDRTAFRRKIE